MFTNLKSLAIPEGNVTMIMDSLGAILWKLKASRLPSEYQEVEYLDANNGAAYIDLGFSFDTKAIIHMDQWIDSVTSTTYPFGAAENSGVLRCLLSSPYSDYAYIYGSSGTEYIASGATIVTGRNEFIMTLAPGKIEISNTVTGNTSPAKTTQGSYIMTNNLYLFAQNYNGSPRYGNNRKISFFKYYDKNEKLICDLIPCVRISDNKPGMYDRARNVFLTTIGTKEFVAGPLKNVDFNVTNMIPLSTNADGSIYNVVGFKTGYRVRSGGAEATSGNSMCTGYIPLKRGDTLRVYPPFSGINSRDAINFSDATYTNLGQSTGSDAGGINAMGTNNYGICVGKAEVYKAKVIDGVSTLTLGDNADSSIAYVRVTHDIVSMPNPSDLIITVNEEIPI